MVRLADDELALRKQMERAAQAKALLDDVLLNEAFAELKQAYLDTWMRTEARDTDARERLWVAQTVLTKVKGHLEQMVTNGTVASVQLADIEEKAKRKPRA